MYRENLGRVFCGAMFRPGFNRSSMAFGYRVQVEPASFHLAPRSRLVYGRACIRAPASLFIRPTSFLATARTVEQPGLLAQSCEHLKRTAE